MQKEREYSECNVKYCARNPTAVIHRLPPKKHPTRRRKWIEALQLPQDVSDTYIVCSDHFKTIDYVHGTPTLNKRLKYSAVPSVNLPPTTRKTRRKKIATLIIGSTASRNVSGDKGFVTESSIDDENDSEDENEGKFRKEHVQLTKVNVTEEKPSTKEDSVPRKSGEIFRTDSGKFSFSCSYCDIHIENCAEMMEHINSHFATKRTPEELPMACPEFISLNKPTRITGKLTKVNQIRPKPISISTSSDVKIKSETTNNASDVTPTKPTCIIRKLTKVNIRPKPISTPSDEKIKSETINKASDVTPTKPTCIIRKLTKVNIRPKPNVVKMISETTNKEVTPPSTVNKEDSKDTNIRPISLPSAVKMTSETSNKEVTPTILDNTKSTSSTNIVKVVKLKRIKLKARDRTYLKNKRMLCSSGQKNGLKVMENVAKASSTVNGKLLVTESVHKTKSCFQCYVEPKILEPSLPRPHICLYCPTTLSNHIQFDEHVRNIHNKDSMCEEILAHSKPKETIWESTTKPIRRSCYQCEMEPKLYEPSTPRRHLCLFCTMKFPNHTQFDEHVRKVHKKDPDFVMCKEFYCYVCERMFIFREYLARHMKAHNLTNDSSHLCEFCGGVFQSSSRLKAHLEIHSNDVFECDQCDKTFNRFVGLRKHLWCHNTKLSFVCDICAKGFKVKRYLDRHMAMHEEPKIQCRHCDAKFHFNTVRRVHERSRHFVL